jgi:hypothetical protein
MLYDCLAPDPASGVRQDGCAKRFRANQAANLRTSDDGQMTAIHRRFAEPEMCDGDEVLVRYAGRN